MLNNKKITSSQILKYKYQTNTTTKQISWYSTSTQEKIAKQFCLFEFEKWYTVRKIRVRIYIKNFSWQHNLFKVETCMSANDSMVSYGNLWPGK